jgi:hypothetical protein
MQFWNRRIYIAFRNFDVNITVPADHVMEATELEQKRSIYCRTSKRYELAQKSFDKPVVIVTQAEAEASEKDFQKKNMEI